MILILIIGLVLLGLGVILLLRGSAFSGGTTGESLGQIESSYGFATRSPAESEEPNRHTLTSFAGSLGDAATRFVGTGERGIRRQLLSAGMYDTEPRTIVGYRVLGAF